MRVIAVIRVPETSLSSRSAVVAVALALGSSCGTPIFELEVTPSPLAIGARGSAAVTRGTCDADDCAFTEVEITALSFEPAGVFDVVNEPIRGDIKLAAIGEGITTLTLTAYAASDGEDASFVHTLGALPVDRVSIVALHAGAPCEVPALFAAGMVAELPIELRQGDIRLHGEGFSPVVTDAGAIDVERSHAGGVVLELPATPGLVSLTSAADPTFSFAIEAFSPQMLDRVTLRALDPRLTPLAGTDVVLDAFIGVRTVCGDALSWTVITETPAICRLADDDGSVTAVTGVGLHTVRVVGVKAGLCTLRATAGTTGLTATASLDVTM